MSYKLTAQQEEAQNKIFEWLDNEDKKFFLLSGYAGTGKTFLCADIVKKRQNTIGDVCVVAPTHKAKDVIQAVFTSLEIDAVFMTVHKLLGIRLELTSEGDEVFVRDNKVRCTANDYNLIIIDECSMISQNLWNWILIECDNKVLFLGDPAQLPPVNEEMAMPFKTIEENDRVLLTDVVRYDSGIAELALKIRQSLEHPKLTGLLDVSGYFDNAPEVITLPRSEFDEEIKKEAQLYPMELKQSEPFKVMAWTNKCVDDYNKILRLAKYGINAKEYEPGEIVICRKPYLENDSIIFPTATELQILAVFKIPQLMCFEGLPSYRLVVTNGEAKMEVETLSNLGTTQYWKKLEEVKHSALRDSDEENRKGKWFRFFKLKYHFISLRPIFASTIHTMQGSGIDKAFVVLSDIERNEKIKEKNQLLYTAITRAKKQVIVLQRWQYS